MCEVARVVRSDQGLRSDQGVTQRREVTQRHPVQQGAGLRSVSQRSPGAPGVTDWVSPDRPDTFSPFTYVRLCQPGSPKYQAS